MCRAEPQEQPWCRWAPGTEGEAAQGSKLQSFESTLLRACLLSTKQQHVKHKTHGNGPQRSPRSSHAGQKVTLSPWIPILVFPLPPADIWAARMV